MYSRIMIISGGSITDAFAKDWMEKYQPEYIIVADSGMEFMHRTGLKPDMIIGDFDSVFPETLDYFKAQEEIVWKELNPIKDDTDTEFAIRQAISLGTKEITVLGATGSRLDHVLGNVALLGIGLEAQVKIQLVDAHNRISMLTGTVELRKEEQFGEYVSFLPVDGAVSGVTLEGFKYPLQDVAMPVFSSLGISNEIVEERARVEIKSGVLLMIESRD